MAVAAEVDAAAHVYPPGGAAVLQDQREEQAGDLLAAGVAEGPVLTGDGDVGGLARQMLGVAGALHGGVELGAAVAGVHLDGQAEVLARGFETTLDEVLQGRNVALQWRVGDVACGN